MSLLFALLLIGLPFAYLVYDSFAARGAVTTFRRPTTEFQPSSNPAINGPTTTGNP